jgi:hypothetical protein
MSAKDQAVAPDSSCDAWDELMDHAKGMDKIQRTLHEEWVRSQPDRDSLVIAMKNVDSLLQDHQIQAGDEDAAKNGLETYNGFLRQQSSLEPNHVKIGFSIIKKFDIFDTRFVERVLGAAFVELQSLTHRSLLQWVKFIVNYVLTVFCNSSGAGTDLHSKVQVCRALEYFVC